MNSLNRSRSPAGTTGLAVPFLSRGLWRLLGGGAESISRGDWHVYLNARGSLLNLQPNLRAAQLAGDAGRVVLLPGLGPVVGVIGTFRAQTAARRSPVRNAWSGMGTFRFRAHQPTQSP
ncbi:hypothetical protein AB0O52_02160 [Arthrobacter sp. NPDC080073]|uniref:hypothetical protein n=1 Tax=Arthrobacter sp. NPDC080073 TaxID=3155919 RepID=UPI00343ECAEA